MILSDITRKQAFITHLLTSTSIFIVLAYLVVFEWYPSYYFFIDGGIRGIITLFFVDVILGPGLTLLLFKPGKPGLKFDMTMVIVFQILALSWGVKSVYSERPAVTVFFDGKFTCLDQSKINHVDMEKLSVVSRNNVVLAMLRRPDTYAEYEHYLKAAFAKGSAAVYENGEKYEVMNQSSINHILEFMLDVDAEIEAMKNGKEEKMKVWRKYRDYYSPLAVKRLYPMTCRYKSVLAVFNPETGTIDDYIPIQTGQAESTVPLKLGI